MDDSRWTEQAREVLLDCRIFRVTRVTSEGPHGKQAEFTVLNAPDWAVVVPVLDDGGPRRILTVRQFRHGSNEMSVEFPGGVVDPGEEPAAAAARELLEETGYRAASIVHLGSCSPNPAFLSNRFHVFVGAGLSRVAEQALDEHEFVDVQALPEDEVLDAVGDPPWSHALMATAAWYYRRWRERTPS